MTAMNQRSSRGRRSTRPRGVLLILTAFLLASAIIRLGENAGQALAQASAADPVPAPNDSSDRMTGMPEDMKNLFDLILDRERKVEDREARLLEQEHALSVARDEIRKKMKALESAEEDLRKMVVMAEQASEKDITQLTKIYESMKPETAATVFEEMDPVFAAGFLARIRPEVAAEILAGLQPVTAHGISVIMAGRNARIPRE